MMRCGHTARAVGVVLGIGLAAGLMALEHTWRGSPRPEYGPLISDCDGALERLVIHYVSGALEITGQPCRDFLRQLPDTVTVTVVCPDEAAFAEFANAVGDVATHLEPLCVRHDMTSWSRDRWLAMAPRGPGEPPTLLAPDRETGGDIWPARKGDGRVAADLAGDADAGLTWQRSPLLFDGGDFVADAEIVLVSPQVLLRNVGMTVATAEELHEVLTRILQRRVVLLPHAPRHHAGMFAMPVGGGRALVGDPEAAATVLERTGQKPPDFADFSPQTRRAFEHVAEACREAGMDVYRIPVVPGKDGRTYLTYVNAILDERDGQRTVYMPVYNLAPSLNSAATAVWERLGYAVRPVDCSTTYRHGGSLRCLVNVLRRTP